MASASVYVGLVVVNPIVNQKRYGVVIAEVLQYLSTHEDFIMLMY